MIELWVGHFDPQTDLIIPGDLASTYVENIIQTKFWPKFQIFALFMKQMILKCYFMASLPMKIVNYRSKLCIFAYLSHVRLSSDPHVRSVCPQKISVIAQIGK